jgi:hypothetical protein
MARRAAEAGDLDLGPRPRSGQPVVDRLDLLEERDLVVRARQDPEAFGEAVRAPPRPRLQVRLLQTPQLVRRRGSDSRGLHAGVAGDRALPAQRHSVRRVAAPDRLECDRGPAAQRRGLVEGIDQHHDLAATGSVEELVAGATGCAGSGSRPSSCPRWQRRVLALRFGHDLTHDAIAKRTGRSQGAVKLLQCRAIARVREAVRAAGDAPGAGVIR